MRRRYRSRRTQGADPAFYGLGPLGFREGDLEVTATASTEPQEEANLAVSSSPALIALVVERLKRVPTILGITLGGSRAVGADTPESDFDIGLYYDGGRPFDRSALEGVARGLDDGHRPGLMTEPGGWGPLVDGGGWLVVMGRPVDLIYREVGRVRESIEASRQGRVTMHYQPGHPHGITSLALAGEIAEGRILHDPGGILTSLKAGALPYPDQLVEAVLDAFLWEADFSVEIARKATPRLDLAYIAGAAFRTVACLSQCLFAINRRYLINEKGAVRRATGFECVPSQLESRVQDVFSRLAPDGRALGGALNDLSTLVGEVKRLVRERT